MNKVIHRAVSRRLVLSGIAAVTLGAVCIATPAAIALPAAVGPTDAYVYPILPGTPSWAALDTHDKMIAATQLPTDVLATMSTEGLVATALSYPLYDNVMMAFTTVQQGFDEVTSEFNGLQGLLKRPDVGSALLKRYVAMKPAMPTNLTLVQKGEHAFAIARIEILLAQAEVQRKLTGAESVLLAQAARNKLNAKRQNPVYGIWSESHTARIIGQMQVLQSPAVAQQVQVDPDVALFLETGSLGGDERAVLGRATTLGSPKPTSALARRAWLPANFNVSVYTPLGTPVPAYYVTEEFTQGEMAVANADVERIYPQAHRETSATRKYNCQTYAWYDQTHSGNSIWIDNPTYFWADGSYKASYNTGGRKMTYNINDPLYHSAITLDTTTVRSKWASWPRMQHKVNYGPYRTNSGIARYFV